MSVTTQTLPETDITDVEGWDKHPIDNTHRIVGVQHIAWFVQALPYHRVIALPPAHLTILEATAWFLWQQNARKEETCKS